MSVQFSETPLWERARGRWPSILPLVGIEARYLTRKNVPCPMCGGKDRFRFTDVSGSGGWVCNQCGHGSGVDLVKLCLHVDFAEAARRIEEVIGRAEPEAKRHQQSAADQRDAMRRLWISAAPITGMCDAGRYLASRGIVPGPNFPGYPACLRSAGAVYHSDYETRFPAMLSKITAPDGTSANVQRTFIGAAEGRRKMMPGTIPAGSAVRLAPLGPTLGLAEGVETALSAQILTGIPTWASVDAGGMARFDLPAGLTELVIFGDHDASYTGQAAAYALAQRAVRTVRVRVDIAPGVGTDWNDVLQSRA